MYKYEIVMLIVYSENSNAHVIDKNESHARNEFVYLTWSCKLGEWPACTFGDAAKSSGATDYAQAATGAGNYEKINAS